MLADFVIDDGVLSGTSRPKFCNHLPSFFTPSLMGER